MGNVPRKVTKPDLDGLSNYTLWTLQRLLRETRQESTGVPLDYIAWAIQEEFTKEEVDALVKHLTIITSSVE